jgi:hypothetical protein
MRKSRFAVAALGMSVLLFYSARSFAGIVSLNNMGGNQSTVDANASDDDFPGNTTTNNVNSLPYTTPAIVTDENTYSTTTPNLSSSAFTATFSQGFTDDNSGASGIIDIFFTANSNATYSISGLESVVGDFDSGYMQSYLNDQTTSTHLYFDDESFIDMSQNAVKPAVTSEDTNVLNLSNASDQTGSMTGSLIAGHSYEFYLSEEADDEFDDPTLTGNGGITFSAQAPTGASAPLPLSAPAALIALLPMALWMKRGRSVPMPG